MRGVLLKAVVLVGAVALALQSPPASAFEVTDGFLPGDEDNELSGMDCLDPDGSGSRLCLVVDDEADFVQFATLSADTLTPVNGSTKIFETEPVFGEPPHLWFRMPSLGCSGGRKDAKADGEAIAHTGRTFYIVGSHGCTRNKKRYSPQSFVLTRIEIAPDGKVARMESTYRLSEAMVVHPAIAAGFGRDIPKEGDVPGNSAGVSIEAMAVKGDQLVIGLRSPAAEGAQLVVVPIADLFRADGEFDASNVIAVSLDLGAHIGFRDIEILADGKTLVALVGPEGKPEPEGPYGLRLIDDTLTLADTAAVNVALPKKGSPEAIEVLDAGPDWPRRVLVLSDGAENGEGQLVSFRPAE